MRGISADGRLIDSADVEPAEAGGMLADLGPVALREFLIGIALAGGASRSAIAGALRCSLVTLRRDIQASRTQEVSNNSAQGLPPEP